MPKTKDVHGNDNKNNKRRGGLVLIAILAVCATFGVRHWIYAQGHVETDDAFIEAPIHSVSPKIAGQVKKVFVKENQLVHKGDVLLLLDESDYRARLKSAAASVDVAKNEIAGTAAQVAASKAGVAVAAARLEQAEQDLVRAETLFASEVISKEQLEKVSTAARVAELQYSEAQEVERAAKALLGRGNSVEAARIAQKRGDLEAAELSLAYTRLVAPADGYVTRKSVEPGNNVQPGQALMAIVPLSETWITANFKESQVAKLRVGQKVEFTVDGYPGRTFKGKVDSIMAGTGAAFSLLPPENATGNYVKVVQRIPVRIAIDHDSDRGRVLRAGMSVVPTVFVGKSAIAAGTTVVPVLPVQN